MIKVRKNPWRLARKTIVIIVLAIVVAIGGIAIASVLLRDTNPLPTELRSSLTFSPVVVPTTVSTYTTDNFRLTRSEDDTQILSYTLRHESYTLDVSAYTQPPQFVEIPEFKDRFLTNVVQQTATVPTASGTIYLGQLSKQDNSQIGVMIEHGLLVFMQPSETLNETQWRSIGDVLEVARNS